MNERLIWWMKGIATWLERLLALGLLVGVAVFALQNTIVLIKMDWHSMETFYELIYRILLLVIGVELIKTLLTHDLSSILELLAFVVARKMLKPEIDTLDVILGTAAFVILLAARRFLFPSLESEPKQKSGTSKERVE